MKFQTLGDKPTFVDDFVRNDESTTTLQDGTPVVYTIDGTEDGLAVVLPATAGAIKTHALFAGVVVEDIIAGRIGTVRKTGIYRATRILRATRAASSDSWSSSASLAAGHLLVVDTVNNVLSTVAASVGATGYLPWAILAQSVASIAASASATSDSTTAITQAAKVFLRVL